MEPSKKVLLIRYGIPNQYDHAPQGSDCKVIVNDREYDLYRQTSSDEANPIWEHAGTFNEQ